MFEAGDRVGGWMRTTPRDGFLVDRSESRVRRSGVPGRLVLAMIRDKRR
ncbi:FAD-dependent oxidoreductase [Hydrocarboniphaga sp.]